MEILAKQNDIRIDKYLREETTYSREVITKMLMSGYIKVNGKITKPSYKVKENDCIEIDESYIKPINVLPKEMPLDIYYEDDDIIVVNKPSGLTVHPGSGNYDNTLVNGLLHYTERLSDVAEDKRPGIVHRLDKDTSGLMLVAKSNKAHEILADDFKNKRVERIYYALIEGHLEAANIFIDAPIGRDQNNFQKMTVKKGGKSARTHATVLQKYVGYSLIKLKLETGRTHQIRVHMAYIGHPIVNDPVYGKNKATEFGQMLHSKEIRFQHPVTGKTLEFSADLPKEFEDFLKTLEKID